MRKSLEFYIMQFAVNIAERSTCSRAKVGTVITSPDMTEIWSYGYNGNYAGGPNECDHPEEEGDCGCIHAEINAIIKCNKKQGLIFSTVAPCLKCAKIIINSGKAKTLFFLEYYRDNGGWKLLETTSPVFMYKCYFEGGGLVF